MGKKSKNKNNKPTLCYHGCTKKEFNNCGEHYNVLERWDKDNKKDYKGFYNKNKRYMENPSFGRFVIARIADDYLKDKAHDHLYHRLCLLLEIRYYHIPRHEGKDVGPESEYDRNSNKYRRDIQTERGRINCMAREIPCDCMEEKRIAAKSMEKVAMCWCCRKEFLKKKMFRCKGCNYVQYCSPECYKKDWPRHKEFCN